MTRARVVSDGDTTRVYVNGVELHNVTALTIYPLDKDNRRVRISLEIINVELDVTGDVEVTERAIK